MRFQGRITEWRDDRGFGFITPNGGGDRVFIHVKDFASSGRRPVGNELVNYHVVADGKGRLRADKVEYVRPKRTLQQSGNPNSFLLALCATFLVIVGALALFGRLHPYIAVGYFAFSAATFLAYSLDKSAAREGNWRTKESSLHLLALIGGWPGALAAQQLLRHKSRKSSFLGTFWVTVAGNLAFLIWLFSDAGEKFLKALARA